MTDRTISPLAAPPPAAPPRQPVAPTYDRGHDGPRFHGEYAARIHPRGREFHGLFRPVGGAIWEISGQVPVRLYSASGPVIIAGRFRDQALIGPATKRFPRSVDKPSGWSAGSESLAGRIVLLT